MKSNFRFNRVRPLALLALLTLFLKTLVEWKSRQQLAEQEAESRKEVAA